MKKYTITLNKNLKNYISKINSKFIAIDENCMYTYEDNVYIQLNCKSNVKNLILDLQLLKNYIKANPKEDLLEIIVDGNNVTINNKLKINNLEKFVCREDEIHGEKFCCFNSKELKQHFYILSKKNVDLDRTILIEVLQDTVITVSCDTKNMVYKKIPNSYGFKEDKVIIPYEFGKLLNKLNKDIILEISSNKVIATDDTNDIRIVCDRINRKYYPYEDIIPKNSYNDFYIKIDDVESLKNFVGINNEEFCFVYHINGRLYISDFKFDTQKLCVYENNFEDKIKDINFKLRIENFRKLLQDSKDSVVIYYLDSRGAIFVNYGSYMFITSVNIIS